MRLVKIPVWRDTRCHARSSRACGLAIPRTGRQGRIGVLVTKNPGDHRRRWRCHAALRCTRGHAARHDKATGEEVGGIEMPAPQTGSPMTYMLDEEQYIVLAISGGGYSGEFVAYRLLRQDRRARL